MDEGKEQTVKKERMKTPSGWKCVPCHGRYKDREEYITHMAEQHGKVCPPIPCLAKMYLAPIFRSYFGSIASNTLSNFSAFLKYILFLDTKIHVAEWFYLCVVQTLKKFPCNKCESSFTTTSSLRRHIRDKHKVVNRGFRCQ